MWYDIDAHLFCIFLNCIFHKNTKNASFVYVEPVSVCIVRPVFPVLHVFLIIVMQFCDIVYILQECAVHVSLDFLVSFSFMQSYDITSIFENIQLTLFSVLNRCKLSWVSRV